MLLSDVEREEALRELTHWSWDPETKAIRRSFRFRDFSEAFGFIARVALAAEKADHHPDWSNSWNRVDVALSTHSEGGVTSKDVELARQMNDFASLAPSPSPH
ncbi:MAG TPA: 4a-hydroxytetrahydrobiopterin dehydratase [Allosphingosinicella sp.]|jgi:4a-hydroxytetrahydrobiopterin dehydratase|nr:4a-hydroxytetrahydrobiopterin dehydratase [Allosphingosinicella sp.]